jgi:predicted amidophosphoribosyltransferase
VAWEYTGLLRELVGVAKIEGRPAAVAALTDLLPEVRPPAGAVVVPVPPSPGRRSGPHLATACARALGRALGCPVVPALSVTRLAAEQHRLTRPERTRNVAGLFTSRAMSAPVLLVDDLLTSGATASAAATVLRGAGAPWVGLVVLGRTV